MKKKKHEEHENLERWLVSYADFITLLFATFSVLYALSQSDKAKYKQVAEAISRSFLSAGGIFPLRGTPFSPFSKPPDKGSAVPPSESDAGRFSKDAQSVSRVREQIKGLFEKSTGLSFQHGRMDVYRTENGFKIRMNEDLLYRSGGDRIRREYVPFLYEIGKRLARIGCPIVIEGHSDASSPRREEDNWQLSVSRSYKVMQFLIQGAGFPKNLISLAGFGDTHPIASNDTPEGRSRNRRVEIAVVTAERDITSLLGD